MKTSKHFIITLAALFLLVSCGGANKDKSLSQKALEDTPDDYTPVAAILGANPNLDTSGLDSDSAEQMADNSAVTQDKDYVGGTMAIFLPTVVANGKEIQSTYSVKTADNQGTEIMSNVRAGIEIEISPGVYDITFKTKDIAGNPENTLRGVELTAGRRLSRKVKFPVGEITLITGSRGCKKSAIKLKLKGASDWMPGKYFTCKPIKLMAGEYEAKQGITEIAGITVYDGGTRKVNIRQQ